MPPASPTSLTAKRLRKRREALGLSVEGLAYKAGISYKTIERIEAGKVKTPRQATVAVIEQAFERHEREQNAALPEIHPDLDPEAA